MDFDYGIKRNFSVNFQLTVGKRLNYQYNFEEFYWRIIQNENLFSSRANQYASYNFWRQDYTLKDIQT